MSPHLLVIHNIRLHLLMRVALLLTVFTIIIVELLQTQGLIMHFLIVQILVPLDLSYTVTEMLKIMTAPMELYQMKELNKTL